MAIPDVNPQDGFPDNIPAGARRRGRAAVAQPALRSLGFDRFSRSGVPGIDDLPQISPQQNSAQGVAGALQGIASSFLATAMNASPMFRAGIALWAVGLLTGLASSLETLLQNEAFKNSPAGGVVQNLLNTVKALITTIGSFVEQWKNVMKGDQELSKSMNELAKFVG